MATELDTTTFHNACTSLQESFTGLLTVMSQEELSGLLDAYQTIQSVICGLNCQPKFWEGGHSSMRTDAGNLVWALLEVVNAMTDAIVDYSADRPASTVDDMRAKARVMVSRLLNDPDDSAKALLAISQLEAMKRQVACNRVRS